MSETRLIKEELATEGEDTWACETVGQFSPNAEHEMKDELVPAVAPQPLDIGLEDHSVSVTRLIGDEPAREIEGNLENAWVRELDEQVGLNAEHEVKDELASDAVAPQPLDIGLEHHALSEIQLIKNEEEARKSEDTWVGGEGAQFCLDAEQEVKDELVLDPEVPQRLQLALDDHGQDPSNVDTTKQEHGSVKTPTAKEFNLKACSVRLRRLENIYEKPHHVCKVCPNTYKNRNNLMRHMRHHVDTNKDVKKMLWYDTEREIYICDICGKVYLRKFNLVRHIRFHMHTKVYHRLKRARVLGLILTQPDVLMYRTSPLDTAAAKTLPTGSYGSSHQTSSLHLIEQHAKLKVETNSSQEPPKKKIYVCDECGKWYTQKSLLITHIRNPKMHKSYHMKKGSKSRHVFCDLCNKRSSSAYSLTTHLLQTHAAVPAYSCQTCHKEFAHKANLATHARIHEKPSITFSCGVCKKQFREITTLCKHHKYVHKNEERPYTCDVCSQKFKRKFDLINHIRTHSGDKPYGCDTCSKRFSQRSNLIIHMRTHHVQKPFECKFCPKQFPTKHRLTLHERTHTGQKPYACDACPMRFYDGSHLRSHKLTHTGQKPHKCKICSMRFLNKGNLKRHEFMHTGEKPHQCEICKKSFAYKESLKRHRITHEATRDYSHVCKICDKRFSSKNCLRTHLKIHTGVKDHYCRFCSKAFITKSGLIRHEYVHTGDRPYGCGVCEWRFPDKSSLNIHQRIHERIKPYSCEVCGKLLKSKHCMMRHIKDHAGTSPQCCDQCGDLFAYKSSFDDHYKVHATIKV